MVDLSEFPDWEKPIDEEELDAVLRAASAASSARKRRKKGDPDAHKRDGQIPAGPIIQGGGGDGGDDTNSVIPRPNIRRLPNWAAAGDTSSSPPRNGIVAGGGAAVDGGTGSERLAGYGSRNGEWGVLSPPSCRPVDIKVKYPLMSFGGRIVYGRTASEVEKATLELWEIIRIKKENMDKISMGFDIEWRPTFGRGEISRKAAVMQICVGTDLCFVLHIIHSGIPSILKSLLEDESYVKVGVAISNDAKKILKDYSVRVAPLDDLSDFANLKLGGFPKKWSLSSLTEMLTCKQLAKPNKIRMGDWEIDVLSREQLHYAATDAFVSWYLYEVLRSFPAVAAKVEGADRI